MCGVCWHKRDVGTEHNPVTIEKEFANSKELADNDSVDKKVLQDDIGNEMISDCCGQNAPNYHKALNDVNSK